MHLPEIDLWLDNTEPCACTWISHGHSDHARGCHGQVIGTPVTLRFYRMRLWMGENDTEPTQTPLDFGQSMEWHGARLTAFPASHILGAAQLLIEFKSERLVYTGDIKLRQPLAGEVTQLLQCDRLIIESTFGLPIYKLLDREPAITKIVSFARECLSDGLTPVFIGYALGRGQEIVSVLCQAGYPNISAWRDLRDSFLSTKNAAIASTTGSRTKRVRPKAKRWWLFLHTAQL